jgi:hypothetical protein
VAHSCCFCIHFVTIGDAPPPLWQRTTAGYMQQGIHVLCKGNSCVQFCTKIYQQHAPQPHHGMKCCHTPSAGCMQLMASAAAAGGRHPPATCPRPSETHSAAAEQVPVILRRELLVGEKGISCQVVPTVHIHSWCGHHLQLVLPANPQGCHKMAFAVTIQQSIHAVRQATAAPHTAHVLTYTG